MRPLVSKYLREEWIKTATMQEQGSEKKNKMTPVQYWKQVHESGAGGNGIVALGRSAYKGVLTGLVDFVGEQIAAKREQEGLVNVDDGHGTISTEINQKKDQERSQRKRTGWFSWLWPTVTTTSAEQQPQNQPSQLETSFNDHFGSVSTEAKEYIVPPIGFIPFQPQSWYRRLYYDRKNVERVGRAALAIAQGDMVPLQDLFPGTIAFSVEDGERESESKGNKAGLDGEAGAVTADIPPATTSSSAGVEQTATTSDTSVETTLSQESSKTPANEEEQRLLSPDPHLVVHVTESGEYILPESLLQHVQMYYKP